MGDPRNGGAYVARRGGDGTRTAHPHERGKRKKNDDEGGEGVASHEEGATTAGHRDNRRGGGRNYVIMHLYLFEEQLRGVVK